MTTSMDNITWDDIEKKKLKKEYGSIKDNRRWREIDAEYLSAPVTVRVTFTTQLHYLQDFLSGADRDGLTDDFLDDYTKIEIFK